MWHYEGSGEYSSKSGYKLLLDEELHTRRVYPMAMSTIITMFYAKKCGFCNFQGKLRLHSGGLFVTS